MNLAIVTCEQCGDTWHVPDPDTVRTVCRVCGSQADIEWKVIQE